MVLRLRGGGYVIKVKAYGIEIDVTPDGHVTVEDVKEDIKARFPTVDMSKMRLFAKNIELK